MEPDKLISSINNHFRNFEDCSFRVIRSDSFCYVIDGQYPAINRFPNESKEVNVIKWFRDFWLFLEIEFKHSEQKVKIVTKTRTKLQTTTHISLSVFQGDDTDNKKNQLFRAEWDDYNKPDEVHAQPHWQITSNQAIENLLDDYADVYEEPEILKEFKKEKLKVIDVKKIHFAMNGDWQNNKTHVHNLVDEQQVVKWLQGLLNHIRIELGS